MGDAAHTMPPHLGQGMLSGIRDAENLAWKLAAVMEGRASDRLLDTYETERCPHARGLIGIASGIASMVLATDPAHIEQRDQILRSGQLPPVVFPPLGPGIVRRSDPAETSDTAPFDGRPSLQARVARGTRVDRLDDHFPRRGWRIVSRHALPPGLFDADQRALLESLDTQFVHASRGAHREGSFYDIDGEYDKWYRRSGCQAFLERPDHYVYGTAERIEDVPALVSDLAAVLARHGWRPPPHPVTTPPDPAATNPGKD